MQERIAHTTWIILALCLLVPAACSRGTPTPLRASTPTLPPLYTPTATLQADVTPTAAPQPSVTPTSSPGVALRIGWLGTSDPLTPFADRPSGMDLILSLIYDRLIYPELDNSFSPAFATNWTSLDDGRTWILNLVSDALAHDGQPLTAQDVAFTIGLYQGHPEFDYYGSQTPKIEKIEVTGPYSLSIVLERPVGNIEALLHWIPLLPERVWAGIDLSSIIVEKEQLVGSGPFSLVEHHPGQEITLAANEKYWMGRPRVDRVVFKVYANADALADALRSGEADLILQVPLSRIAELRANTAVQVVSGPQLHLRTLLFNSSEESHSTGHPALRDPRVRLAIGRAIDKQQLVDLAFLGYAMPGLSIVPPVLHRWFNARLLASPFDLDEAIRILNEAGYTDRNADGVLEMPDSATPLALRLFIPSDSSTGPREAEMIGNWLRQIGIRVNLTVLDPEALKATCCPACDYDMILWQQSSSMDPGFSLSTLTTPEILSGINKTGYSNPLYDALYNQQATMVNQSERRQIVWQMQEIALEQLPCLVLCYDLAVQAFRKDRFHNWLFVPNGRLSLADERSLLQVEPVR